MSYILKKPDAGPSPALDASIIQGNFAAFATVFATNHIALNNVFQGDHSFVYINNRTNDPGVTGNFTVLYAKDTLSNAGTEPQLYAQIPTFLPTDRDSTKAENLGMLLTYNTVDTAGPQYQSFLPGGYFIIFGTQTGMTVPGVKISDQVILTVKPTKLLAVFPSPYTLTTSSPKGFNVSAVIDGTDRFTIYSTGNGTSLAIPYSIGWLAIGTI